MHGVPCAPLQIVKCEAELTRLAALEDPSSADADARVRAPADADGTGPVDSGSESDRRDDRHAPNEPERARTAPALADRVGPTLSSAAEGSARAADGHGRSLSLASTRLPPLLHNVAHGGVPPAHPRRVPALALGGSGGSEKAEAQRSSRPAREGLLQVLSARIDTARTGRSDDVFNMSLKSGSGSAEHNGSGQASDRSQRHVDETTIGDEVVWE